MIASRTAPARIGELKVMRLRRELRETGRVRNKDDENWTHFLPVVLLMPFGFHLAMDTLPPGEQTSFSGQRGITPAFGYGPPHPSARRTSTFLNNTLLSTLYARC